MSDEQNESIQKEPIQNEPIQNEPTTTTSKDGNGDLANDKVGVGIQPVVTNNHVEVSICSCILRLSCFNFRGEE